MTVLTKKRVRFHENEFICLPTYSREEYDRKSSMETFTLLIQSRKRKLEEDQRQQEALTLAAEHRQKRVAMEGSWADSFLSMGSSDLDIWAS
jgi:hypothetical protein